MDEEERLYSRIGLMKDNGNIYSVYCEYNGDLENVGRTLYENYNNRELVSNLIKKGSIERLGIAIDSDKKEDKTTFLIRDRHLPSSLYKYVFNRNLNGFLRTAQEIGAEYSYLFTDKDDWLYIDMKTGDFDRLEDKLKSLDGVKNK